MRTTHLQVYRHVCFYHPPLATYRSISGRTPNGETATWADDSGPQYLATGASLYLSSADFRDDGVDNVKTREALDLGRIGSHEERKLPETSRSNEPTKI